MRLAYLFLADEPLLYAHPYNYFHGALSIVEHPHPWRFVLTSDAWHRWLGPWTIAPLYYLLVAAVMAVFGAHLRPIQLVQTGLDAGVAVFVGLVGRRISPRYGAWAGIAYALNAHAIEQCGTTLTENLHTPLTVAGMALLLMERWPRGRGATDGETRRDLRMVAAGGFLLGLSALARSVSAAFVPVAALWRWREERGRGGASAAAVLALAASAAVLPWTLRNVVFIGEWVPIETNGVYNFWDDNAFVEGERRRAQEHAIARQPTLAAQRAQALRLGWRGIRRNPGRFVEKAWLNLLHFVRPDGLHLLLRVEHAQPAWRHAALVLLDDAILAPTVALFLVFALAGAPSAQRRLLLLWTGYYLLMVVVVFHNEIRYRSTLLPFALACAAGGLGVLTEPARRSTVRARLSAVAGALAAAAMLAPYPVPAWRALISSRTVSQAASAVGRGDVATADQLAWQAAHEDPTAARPWLVYGRALAAAGRPAQALAAYERAAARKAHHWAPVVVRPRLLVEAGRAAEADAAAQQANRFSYDVDPWQALELAWRELPAPATEEVNLARDDYGAARGFSLPLRDHRWSRGHAWVRLRLPVAAPAYDVTLEMGSPPPSPYQAPEVRVSVQGGTSASFRLGRDVAPYVLRTAAPAGGVLLVRLDGPTWSRSGQPADQGIRLDRLRVSAVSEGEGIRASGRD